MRFKTLKQIKIDHIKAALVHFNGNKTQVAKVLECSVGMVKIYCRTIPELLVFRKTIGQRGPNVVE